MTEFGIKLNTNGPHNISAQSNTSASRSERTGTLGWHRLPCLAIYLLISIGVVIDRDPKSPWVRILPSDDTTYVRQLG